MKSFLFGAISLLFTTMGALAQNQDDMRNLCKDNIAIESYDPVSYFTENEAIKGKEEFSVTIDGATYYTSSTKNQKLLKNNPEKYQPQYGGWCAYAMGDDGSYVGINPKAFKVKDGKLYLFYKNILSNTLKKWNENEAELMKKADRNWKEKQEMAMQ